MKKKKKKENRVKNKGKKRKKEQVLEGETVIRRGWERDGEKAKMANSTVQFKLKRRENLDKLLYFSCTN